MKEREMAMALVRLIAGPAREQGQTVRQLARSVDLSQLLELLAPQRLVSALGGLLLDDPEIDLPTPIAQRIQDARTQTRRRGLVNFAITKQLADDLAQHRIRVVPLKGAALADAVYGDIGARESTDIDLLVELSDLERAVTVAEARGWREPELRKAGVPSLHRELFHPDLPPLEVHWRVHWYERSFADAAIARAQPTEHGWLRPQPADEIAFLLLFLARDGFAGLRQLVDVAAWWASLGQPGDTARGVREIKDRHPELAPALSAAGAYVEEAARIPRGALAGGVSPSARGRVAIRLADPWHAGSRAQIAAQISLADALLAPSRGLPAYVQRQLLVPRWELVRRQPQLEGASRLRLGAVRSAHVARVLARYGLAARALLPHRRN